MSFNFSKYVLDEALDVRNSLKIQSFLSTNNNYITLYIDMFLTFSEEHMCSFIHDAVTNREIIDQSMN